MRAAGSSSRPASSTSSSHADWGPSRGTRDDPVWPNGRRRGCPGSPRVRSGCPRVVEFFDRSSFDVRPTVGVVGDDPAKSAYRGRGEVARSAQRHLIRKANDSGDADRFASPDVEDPTVKHSRRRVLRTIATRWFAFRRDGPNHLVQRETRCALLRRPTARSRAIARRVKERKPVG